ncbi:MAG: Uma2 family endonuclease [Chloroflexota bacterium]|nr:Uma2 family endonuclease [Chloroflexota bacterium]MDE2909707.1 Uma2 family endonuclease [Chloroflexota bacterium]
MATQERLLDIDAVSELIRQPEFADKRFYLMGGEIFEMSPVQRVHSRLASIIDFFLRGYVMSKDLGEVHVELGFHPPGDRHTLLAPDVAFVSHARLSQQPENGFLSIMPELAVEIASPSDSLAQLRRKARIYLDNGSRVVWIVLPSERGVDVCRSADGARLDIEFIGADGLLSGEDALPGFELELSRLFPTPK